ncbi:ATP-binding protein [Polaribacter sp. AHE13PA]|uniref:AAA family ATPase n=1 Tax=Polaribacter sp. AHE13PA TaxID=2745562 RepID=UPI001C4EE294|nr:ATP-binding protein [Polaribacter sp. AHE13PA]QXP66923.1 AAA family ATPase [Polaribacter sp. AHE13PA]
MKINIRTTNHIDFPEEFKEPNFYIDNIDNKFIEVLEDNTISTELEISNINFFVGENNSGKSRFLRGLLKLNYPFENLTQSIFFPDLISEISETEERLNEGLVPKKVLSEVIHITDNLISNFNIDDNEKIDSYLKELHQLGQHIYENEDKLKILKTYTEQIKTLQNELVFTKKNKINNKIYIPILRSLLSGSHLGTDSFINTVKTLYFKNKTNFEIHSGLRMWSKIDEIQSSDKIRDLEKFQDFLSNYFFNKKRVQILADRKTKVIKIATNNGEFEKINDLGDGIQALIILLYPIFTADINDCFYIDEPEINLHPAFQKIFIDTLLYDEFLKSKNLKFFFTTHSNHLLDLTLLNDSVSIFQFQKIEENKHLIKTKVKPNKEILNLLGVTASSVFLSNSSIWVEGPTDRKYLSKFLKLYSEDNKDVKYLNEDIDFAFFEYGGNLIAHYLFDDENIKGEGEDEFNKEEVKEKINSFALSNKIFLLADNDNVIKDSKKDLRRKSLEKLSKDNQNFTYQNTELKEIENLLPKKIIKDFMFKILKTEESIRIANKIDFSRNDYKNIGIGDFYENLFLKNKIPKEDIRTFKAESGTLKNDYKIKLASFVIDSGYTYSDLIEENDELKSIIEILYDFIEK